MTGRSRLLILRRMATALAIACLALLLVSQPASAHEAYHTTYDRVELSTEGRIAAVTVYSFGGVRVCNFYDVTLEIKKTYRYTNHHRYNGGIIQTTRTLIGSSTREVSRRYTRTGFC